MGKSESTGFNKIIFFRFIKLPGVVTLQLTIVGNLLCLRVGTNLVSLLPLVADSGGTHGCESRDRKKIKALH